MHRQLHIASYDIRCPKRLAKALKILRDYASGGQYSCFECYLSKAEKAELLARMQNLMAPEDGFVVLHLPKVTLIITLGAAVMPMDDEIYIVC